MSLSHPSAEQLNDAALDALDRGDYEAALALNARALQLAPRDAQLHYHRGNLLSQMKYYKEAAAELSYAIGLRPNYTYALVTRGMVLSELDETEQALRDLNLAIQIDPTIPTAWFNRGLLHADLKQWSRAAQDLAECCRLKPYEVKYFSEASHAHLLAGLHRESFGYANRALELGCREPTIFSTRGQCYLHFNDYGAALADLNHAIALNPNVSIWYLHRGDIYREMGDFHRAFTDYCTDLRMDGPSHPTLARRADLYREAGRWPEALADLSAAIQIKSDRIDLYYDRAQVYREPGRQDLAEQDLRARDSLIQGYAQELQTTGQVVPTVVIQANINLYSVADSHDDHFCLVLLSFDPRLLRSPPLLHEIASRIYATKGHSQQTPELQYVSRMVTNEQAVRYRRRLLPLSFTGGMPAYVCDLLVYRKYLSSLRPPENRQLLCIAEPGDEGRIELLPQAR